MAIEGKKRENQGFEGKKVGLFAAKVVAVNPDREEFKEVLGIELKDESKADNYLGEKDGNVTLRLNFWLEEVKTKQKFNVTFFLENKEKSNKDNTKKQYINETGSCSWADDPNNLPKWFAKNGEDSYRIAYVGEEELYNFVKTWFGGMDFREGKLSFEWKKLIKGNVKEIRDNIGADFTTNVVAMATVKTVEKDGEMKEYQGIYNKAFLPEYVLKNFRLVDYNKIDVQEAIKKKLPKDQKSPEKFVLNVIGQYGCQDSYIFKDLKDYNSADFLVGSDKTLQEDDASY